MTACSNRRRANLGGTLRRALAGLLFVSVLALLLAVHAGLVYATTTRSASAIYSYDRAAQNAQGARASVPAVSDRVAALTRKDRAREAPGPRLGDLVAAKAGGRLPWTSWGNYPKVSVGGREYAQVGERLYTRHAVERTMPRGLTTEGRSISPNYVEDVIQTSTRSDVVVDGVPRQIYRSGTVEVVTEQGGTIVVTVNPYKYAG